MSNKKKLNFYKPDYTTISYDKLVKELTQSDGEIADQIIKLPEDSDPKISMTELAKIPIPIRISQSVDSGSIPFDRNHAPTIVDISNGFVTVEVLTMEPILNFNKSVHRHLYYAAMGMVIQEKKDLSIIRSCMLQGIDESIYVQLRNGILPESFVGPTFFEITFEAKTFREVISYLDILAERLEVQTAIIINQI